MKLRFLAKLLLLVFALDSVALFMLPARAADKKDEKPKSAQSIAELKTQLEKILADTHTPGMSIAIVHKAGPEWVAGLGTSDVATKHATTDETLFRIGSTSKAFAALSILKLVDEGKISLNDPVHKLAPEIYFENKWEATNPVRVVDLLEHTTGWDDLHLAEYAMNAKGWTLKQGLDYYKKSRVSRWPPGTRESYCNSGPPVAAYIVEKITGKRFEDYVAENLFAPIGMKTATYFEAPSPQLTTLYHDDGKTTYEYWNILLRPAGSINASAKDMAAYVQFYLNRGTVNGTAIVPAADVDRMENPTRTWAAQEGLKKGYGLSNYWSINEGFVYHGHDGGVEGGLTEMAYMTDADVGYFYSINSGNGDAFDKIGKTIRAYVTRNLQKPALPAAMPLPADASEYAGWYEQDNPRNEFSHFLDRILGMHYLRFSDGKMWISNLGELDNTAIPTGGEQFRYIPRDDAPHPIASYMLLSPKSEGRFVALGNGTYRHIPAWKAWLEIGITCWWLLALAATLLYAPVWLIGGLFKSRRRPDERAIKVWTLVSALSVIGFCAIFAVSGSDLLERMGNLTIWSAGLFVFSLLMGIAPFAALFSCVRSMKKDVRGYVRWIHRFILIPMMIVVIYLLVWGVIGMRTWS
jgi:CubicO group peptidase (beta-lactamase class C family)